MQLINGHEEVERVGIVPGVRDNITLQPQGLLAAYHGLGNLGTYMSSDPPCRRCSSTVPGRGAPRSPQTPCTPGGSRRGEGGDGRARDRDAGEGGGRGQVRPHGVGGRGPGRDLREGEGEGTSKSELA